MDLHHKRTSEIAQQVQSLYAKKKPFRIYHGSTNSTRILEFKRDEMVDVSGLNNILGVDAARSTVVVEPNVPMDALLTETLKYRLVAPVIPEFPGITVGGAVQGGAGESSSFKWGFVSQTINWIEMVLADGTVITCSPTKNADLFYGAAGASGTLGIITAAEVQLVPAKLYVELTYTPVDSFSAATKMMQHVSRASCDFVDCIMFGPNSGLVISGVLTNQRTHRLQRFSRAHDPWFYLHAQKINTSQQKAVETVPLKDYLFRYDRGAFWVGRFAFERFGIPYNRYTRFILNPLLHTRELYKALQDSGASQEHLVQDLTVPLDKATEFMRYVDKTTGIYPLWLCPVKPETRSPLLCNALDTPLAINIGIWGPRMPEYEKFVALNRELEQKLSQMGGKKWMYAHAYYSKEEFWQIYDKKWYDALRKKYKAETLPDIYQKTVVTKRYAVSARRGLLNTMFGKAKLRVHD